MNLQHESYLIELRRREQLADLDRRWQVVDLVRSQTRPPFLRRLRTGLYMLGQVRRICIQISFEVNRPCPETVP